MNYRPFTLRAAALALFTLQSAFAVDFTLSVSGSRTVTRGYSAVVAVRGKITAGTDEQAYAKVSGLPEGSTSTWWLMKLTCCKDHAWRITNPEALQISVPATAKVGTYPVTITYTSFSGVSRSTTFPLQVVAETQQSAVQLPPDVELPELPRWKTNMEKHGRQHCTPQETAIGNEGYAWYYDGARVYEQIAKETGDATYLTCSQMFNDAYRKHIENAKGNIPGWRYFPHGLAMNYKRTGDELSRSAVLMMANGSDYTSEKGVNAIYIDASYTREIAYATSTLIQAERLGRARTWKLSFLVDCLLSHFEQWFVQRSAKPQPFMVALAAEALIDYYDLTGDPRVPGTLKMGAEGLWAMSWDPVSQSFWYETMPVGGHSPAPDMNMLIVPLFGWVFQHTGEAVHRERGDIIFASGATKAWLDGGKHFSHNYRWSGKYVEWRRSGKRSTAVPASVASVSGTPQSAAVGAPFTSPLAAIVKDKDGKPLSGVNVTFTSPASGASATFGGARTVTATTNASGIATTVAPVANATAGSYVVTATVTGVSPAPFALTNAPSASVSVTVGSLTLPWSPQGLPVTLSAQVGGNAGAANGGTVQFRVSGTVVATVAVSAGRASATHTIPSTVAPGAVPVEARFSGWNSYPAATGTGSVTIVRRNPVITWATPAAIQQGTPLGSAQLNARADIAGTFSYSPAAGTLLPGGTHTLNATFTPSDKARYNSATATTKITVAASSTKPPAVAPVSAVAIREAGTKIVIVTVTFRNSGGPSQSTSITVASLGGSRALALPAVGPVGENQTATVTLKFPATVSSGPATLLLFTSAQGAALNVTVP